MNENEAKYYLLEHKPIVGFKTHNEALDVAIQALEEIQQYRAIGTVEEFQHFITAWDELKILIDIAKNELSQYKSIGTIEEFKALKDGSIPIIHGKAELELYGKEIRNKAIDEFAERIALEISESIIWGMLPTDCKDGVSDEIVDYVIDTSKKVAEQMKAGRNNERNII